jgi:hypothetical protein
MWKPRYERVFWSRKQSTTPHAVQVRRINPEKTPLIWPMCHCVTKEYSSGVEQGMLLGSRKGTLLFQGDIRIRDNSWLVKCFICHRRVSGVLSFWPSTIQEILSYYTENPKALALHSNHCNWMRDISFFETGITKYQLSVSQLVDSLSLTCPHLLTPVTQSLLLSCQTQSLLPW